MSIVEKQITAFYPDAEVSIKQPPTVWPKDYKLVGYHMAQQKQWFFPIRFPEQMQDDPLNDMANVLSKLQGDEVASIQVIVSPSFSNRWGKIAKRYASLKFKGKEDSFVARIPILSPFIRLVTGVGGKLGGTFAPGASGGDSFVRMIQPEEELYKHMGEKAGMSPFHVTIRVMGAGKTWARALDITNNIQVAFNIFKDLYGNSFVNRRMFVDFFPLKWNAPIIHWLWKYRINGYYNKACILVERELAGLYHFPDSRYNKIPIIQWISYRVLPPPPNAPQEGVVLGINDYRATKTEIHFLDKDRTRHQYIIGKSGCGKSSLARNAAHRLGWRYLEHTVNSRTEITSLLWDGDNLRRLQDAHRWCEQLSRRQDQQAMREVAKAERADGGKIALEARRQGAQR